MRITVLYIAVSKGKRTAEFCSRFVATYRQFPAGADHRLLVIGNGGPLSNEIGVMFQSVQHALLLRPNDGGWDVSAYMEVAQSLCADDDIMVCLGESNYFHREGWLRRLVEAWERHGGGMYGPYSSNVIRGHLQTTAFCCGPDMIRLYPYRVASRLDRYRFEHSQNSLWRILAAKGFPVMLVTWDGEYRPKDWRKPANILWRGDQSNLLMFSNHTDNYRDAGPARQRSWGASADRPFV